MSAAGDMLAAAKRTVRQGLPSPLLSLYRASRDAVPARVRTRATYWWHWLEGEPELRLLPTLVDPSATSIDVGANLGIYTFFLARCSRHVFAYEPNPNNVDVLRSAAFPNVTIIPSAASDRPGEAELMAPSHDGHEMGGLGSLERLPVETFAHVTRHAVSCVRLDDRDHGRVGFLKVDVEGHEAAALRGAEKLLARDHPTILVEAEQRHTGRDLRELFAWLEARGYAGQFLRGGSLRPLEEFSVERDQLAYLRGGDIVDRRRYVNNFVFASPHRRSRP